MATHKIKGTPDDDSLIGDSDDNRIFGRAGDDQIDGGPGDDRIKAGSGDDEVDGGSGDDRIDAGSGDDQVDGGSGDDKISGGSGDDEIDGGSGDDRIRAGSGDDQVDGGTGDDKISAGSGDDEVDGGSGDDKIWTGSGDDVVDGGSGNDKIDTGSGDDQIDGGSGNDRIKAGSGDDLIDGGSGDDKMSGGSGDDVFRFVGNFGDDVVKDFDKTSDRIDLTAFLSYELEQDGNDTIVIVDGGGTIRLKNVTPDGLDDAIDVACVVRGTLVRTPGGDVPVETLAIGDEVVSIDGSAKRVKWIGRRSYGRAFIRRNPKVAPTLIKAGALGAAGPERDLMVSPEHAIHVDGALVPAKLLVNGDTICQVTDVESVDYFHVEVDAPDVLWTNGALTESYVNHGNRRMFSNWKEYVDRYGAEDEASRGADGEYVRRFKVLYGGAALQSVRTRLIRTTTLTDAA